MKNSKMRFKLIVFLIWVFAIDSHAQNKQIITCGTIKYERKISMKKKLTESQDEDNSSSWMETYIKSAPVAVIDQFVMQFNPDASLFYFDKKISKDDFKSWGTNDVASKNTVYKDLKQNQMTSFKEFYDSDFILEDSLKKFDWKLTKEFREIAGFECRRATTIINDSLYVIAFYTDDIHCSTGPESFSGLPGTILGLVIPRLYTTWFATEVKTQCDDKFSQKKPVKGKKSNEADLILKIKDKYGSYKKWYHSLIWSIVI